MKDHLLPETSTTRVGQCFHRGLGTYHQAARAQAQIARDLAGMLAECGAPERFESAGIRLRHGTPDRVAVAAVLYRRSDAE